MKFRVLHSDEIQKKEWDEFVLNSPQGHVFVLSDILDKTVPGWKGCFVYDNREQLVAVMPFFPKRKFLVNSSIQPVITKYTGILFRGFAGKNIYNEYHFKSEAVKIIAGFLKQDFRFISFNCSPAFDYPLPFFWENFQVNTKYTYLLDLSRPYDTIRSNYKNSLRTKLSGFRISDFRLEIDNDFDDHRNVFRTKFVNSDFHITDNYFDRLKEIYHILLKKNLASFYSVKTKDGDTMASVLFFFYKDTIYYYLGLMNPEYRQYPALAFIIDHVIRQNAGKYRTFDFQGSMIRRVETFVRGFGSVPVPYLNITLKKFPLNILK